MHCQIEYVSGSGVDGIPCGKAAVSVCADCGASICSDCSLKCCPDSFCEYCCEYHVKNSCLKKPVRNSTSPLIRSA
jgi:hypothetical protein